MTPRHSINGILLVEKPIGPTSHDIVHRCRRILGRGKKVGHAGTLDPFASGLLVVMAGQATRLSRYFQESDKEYIARVRLGQETDTYDREGTVISDNPVPDVEGRDLSRVLDRFKGPIMQVPPMYSAIRINGKRLYQLARNNQVVDRPPRKINIHQLELLEESHISLTLRVVCSSGTYIRSLAHDLGRELGCGAHLESLVRTLSGSFTLDQAHTLEEIEKNPERCLVPMIELLPEMPSLEIDEASAELVRNGRPVPAETGLEKTEIRLFNRSVLVAISRYDGEMLHPMIVFNYD